MLTLFYAPGSCSLAPLVALEEAQARYRPVRVLLAENEQRSAEYLAVNPRARIPALVTADGVITENLAVLTYIAHRFPDTGLLPFDNSRRLGQAYQFMSWFASTAHVAIAQVWRTERFTADADAQEAVRRDGHETLHRLYDEIEAMMTDDWLVGGRYSVVDPYALVFWRWGERLGKDMASFEKWAAHTERLKARAATVRAFDIETGENAGVRAMESAIADQGR